MAPNVLTFDVEDRAGAPILGLDGVARALVDVRDPEGRARLAEWSGSRPIDLLYIDALKDGEFVETTLAVFSDRTVKWLVIDDILANMSIRTAWNRIRQEHESRATTLDEVVIDLRSGGYGQGVVAMTGQSLEGLPTDLLRDAAARRWSATTAALGKRGHGPADQEGRSAALREAVAGCAGEGEIVVVGADPDPVRTLADALVRRADLDAVSVHVMAGFLGSAPAEPNRGPAVRRREPSLDEFRQQLGSAAGLVNLIAGDVPSLRWPGRPIELLVVGWVRDPTRLAYVWRELLPWCIPGGSLILVNHMNRRSLESPYKDLGWLQAHLDIVAVGPDFLALAPVSTPEPAALRDLVTAPSPTGWSPLGVPSRPPQG
jgi:hypothetical protein